MEEALKCGAPAAVVGEIWSLKGYSLAASRRLLLAARKGRTPALLVLASAYGQADRLSSAAETRFEIAAAPSARIPGGGRPRPARPLRLRGAARQSAPGLPARRAGRGDRQGPRRAARMAKRGRLSEDSFDDPAISLSLAAASGDGPRPAAHRVDGSAPLAAVAKVDNARAARLQSTPTPRSSA